VKWAVDFSDEMVNAVRCISTSEFSADTAKLPVSQLLGCRYLALCLQLLLAMGHNCHLPGTRLYCLAIETHCVKNM